MKKFIYLFFSMVFFASIMNAQTDGELIIFDLISSDKDVQVWGMSPNGQYSTGYVNGGLNSFTWTKSNGLNEFDINSIFGSEAYDVSDNGIVVGNFYDSTYMYLNWNEILTPMKSAGYFKNGKWNSLGVKYSGTISDERGSEAFVVSSNGTVIGGSWKSVDDVLSLALAPVVWSIDQNDNVTAIEYEYLQTSSSARISALSGDGSIAGGWADYLTVRVPAIWTDQNTIRYIHDNGLMLSGEVFGISENGHYAVLDFDENAAVYDIENDKLTIIPKSEGSYTSFATAVSNDGIVVGYDRTDIDPNSRVAFIYHERFGKIFMKDYLEALNMTVDVHETFVFRFPAGISADGKSITGYGTMLDDATGFIYHVGWYLEIPQHLDGVNPPENLIATEVSYGNIDLTWEAPTADIGHNFEGYNLYRNGVKLNQSILTDANYSDNNLQNGTYVYTVKAVWDGQESPASRGVKINTAMLNLPFFDDFSDNGFDGKFWNKSMPYSERWSVSFESGIFPPSISYSNPKGNVYQESIISAHIDASNAQDLYLSYNIANAVKSFDWISSQDVDYEDSLRVELYDGTSWNIIDTYGPYDSEYGSRSQAFEYKIYDISQYAGNKIRIRLTAFGDNPGTSLMWILDNIDIYTSDNALSIEAPLKTNSYIDSENRVHVIWADPNEVAKLSYMELEEAVGGIGNEGVPFIAAIMFTPQDLEGFDGYIMKEITVNLFRVYEDINDTAQYKLVAFQDGIKVLDQTIDSYVAREWNTFTLNTPLTIDAAKTLYFGVEVTSHDFLDWPVSTVPGNMIFDEDEEIMINLNDGWANLISEDNGASWKTLTSYNSDLLESFAIKATIYKDENTTSKERILGYKIYRNGEELLNELYGEGALSILNNFVDATPPTGQVCYEITAYYDIQQESDKSDKTCVGDASITEPDKNNAVNVYPNPTNNTVYITGNIENVLVYDIKGDLLMNVSYQNQIKMNELPAGIYFLKITSDNEQITVKKVIKQ